jgi:hypothetical protein
MSVRTRRDGPGCCPTGQSVVAGSRSGTGLGFSPTPGSLLRVLNSGRCADPASPDRRQGKSCSSVVGRLRSDAVGVTVGYLAGGASRGFGGMNSQASTALRQALAVLAAHSSASLFEGTSTAPSPPMASGYGPSVTVPPVATMLAFWLCSPLPKTHTPALMASWTTLLRGLGHGGHLLAGDVVHRVGTE